MSRLVRSYSELRHLETFKERYDYLALGGEVGASTFGFDRYLNQQFYTSKEWKDTRYHVIARDNGCDLGIEGFEIFSNLYVHHMNPMVPEDIIHGDSSILDPEFLITVSHKTHNAIHYGDESQLPRVLTERTKGDTRLW